MRLIEEFKDKDRAALFSDYLTQLEVPNKITEDEEEGVYEVWVISEDQLERAEKLLKRFTDEVEFIDHVMISKEARKKRKDTERETKAGPRYIDARTTVFARGPSPTGAMTMMLIVVSVVVSLISKFGEDTGTLGALFITDVSRVGNYIQWSKAFLPEVMSGEVWRLFTPMFIHFGIMHLVFNMLWLKDLGSMIEDRKGTVFLGIFILVTAAGSNLAQYMVTHPLFGGMSGVVYGLLGYIWMKGKYDPGSRLYLHKTTVIFMLGWFVLCFTGLVGNVANAAHAAGLIIGTAWGFLTSKKIF
jgi:GlpG protein